MPTTRRTPTRKIDQNVDSTYTEFRSKFALVTKARANIWLVTATTLFIVGLLTGAAILVDPNSVLSGNLKGMFGLAAFTNIRSTQQSTGTFSGYTLHQNTGTSALQQDNGDSDSGSTTCVRAPAQVTASPTTVPSLANGSSTTYNVTIKNRDTAACGPAAFVLSHGPTGALAQKFNFKDYAFAHILAPGASVTTPIEVSPYSMEAASNISYLFTTHHSINTSTRVQNLDCALIGNNTVNGGPATTTKLNTTGGAISGERSVIIHSTGCTYGISDAPVDTSVGFGDDGSDGSDDGNPGDGNNGGGSTFSLTAATGGNISSFSNNVSISGSDNLAFRWDATTANAQNNTCYFKVNNAVRPNDPLALPNKKVDPSYLALIDISAPSTITLTCATTSNGVVVSSPVTVTSTAAAKAPSLRSAPIYTGTNPVIRSFLNVLSRSFPGVGLFR